MPIHVHAYIDKTDKSKYATGAKVHGKEDITIATLNVRTLTEAGKLEEFLHKMDQFKWSSTGLCEMRRKKCKEIPIDDGHRVYKEWVPQCKKILRKVSYEPSHEIMVLSVFRKLILQTRMCSHPVGLDV